ncbi:MAG: hypothetical protein GF365_02780 [Candidatus Buchananbacteria bacterium]|nr:hypothetical protein [Candidatus Buchananbacteria bacterium]
MSQDYFSKQISLRSDEEIITVLHHHPITYAKQIVITLAIILLAFFLMFYLFSLGTFGVALFLALLLTGVFYGMREFYIWFMNVFIITNQRIIDIDQTGFFNKTVSEADYNKILDVCYSVKGAGQTLLKLGTININATGVKLVIKNVKDVVKANQILADLIRERTGKDLEIKRVKETSNNERKISSQNKEKITEDFLNQEDLEEYDEYDLDDLIDEYKDIFGELRLKKFLVDELEEYDQEQGKEQKQGGDEPEVAGQGAAEDEGGDEVEDEGADEAEDEGAVEVGPRFKKKKL